MILNYSYEYLHHTHSVLALYMLCTCSVHALYTLRTEPPEPPKPLASYPHFIPTDKATFNCDLRRKYDRRKPLAQVLIPITSKRTMAQNISQNQNKTLMLSTAINLK